MIILSHLFNYMHLFRVIVLLGFCATIFQHHTTSANEPHIIRAAVAKEFKDGLHHQYLSYIANQLGMEIKITTMPFARRMVEVKKGNLDIIVGVQYSQVRASELIYIFPAYEKLSFRYFSLNGNAGNINNYNDLLGKTIGVIRGSKYFPDFEQDDKLQKYAFNNLKANIDMLLHGRIDLFVHYDESTALMLRAMGVEHLIKKTNHQPEFSYEHHLAVSKNSPLATKTQQLIAIIEKGISQQDFVQLRLEHYQQGK